MTLITSRFPTSKTMKVSGAMLLTLAVVGVSASRRTRTDRLRIGKRGAPAPVMDDIICNRAGQKFTINSQRNAQPLPLNNIASCRRKQASDYKIYTLEPIASPSSSGGNPETIRLARAPMTASKLTVLDKSNAFLAANRPNVSDKGRIFSAAHSGQAANRPNASDKGRIFAAAHSGQAFTGRSNIMATEEPCRRSQLGHCTKDCGGNDSYNNENGARCKGCGEAWNDDEKNLYWYLCDFSYRLYKDERDTVKAVLYALREWPEEIDLKRRRFPEVLEWLKTTRHKPNAH